MNLVFLYGSPGVGKLTVAKALCERTGLPLFHNHLTVDLLTPLFPFGSEPFVALREEIWLSVFAAAARSGTSLIFTFAPERTVSSRFIPEAVATVERNGGTIVFVELTCSREELERRVEEPSRRAHGKIASREHFRELEESGVFDAVVPVEPALRIDTTSLTPEEAAARIAQARALPPLPGGERGKRPYPERDAGFDIARRLR